MSDPIQDPTPNERGNAPGFGHAAPVRPDVEESPIGRHITPGTFYKDALEEEIKAQAAAGKPEEEKLEAQPDEGDIDEAVLGLAKILDPVVAQAIMEDGILRCPVRGCDGGDSGGPFVPKSITSLRTHVRLKHEGFADAGVVGRQVEHILEMRDDAG